MQLFMEPVVSKLKTISSGGGPATTGAGAGADVIGSADETSSTLMSLEEVSITLSAAEFSLESGAMSNLFLVGIFPFSQAVAVVLSSVQPSFAFIDSP